MSYMVFNICKIAFSMATPNQSQKSLFVYAALGCVVVHVGMKNSGLGIRITKLLHQAQSCMSRLLLISPLVCS